MLPLYRDYFWKKGTPYGIEKTSGHRAYKIVADPYHKHISIELYEDHQFVKQIYSSLWLDFRVLDPAAQAAWSKEIVLETESSSTALIRDENDRLLYKEIYTFKQGFCTHCYTLSPNDITLSEQHTSYLALGDAQNRAALYDAHQHPICYKFYEADPSGNFTVLTRTQDDMSLTYV